MSNKVYQWIKGDEAGKIVKWDGTIETVEGVGNFLIFEDGTRGNENLMNDFFMELLSEDEPILYDEMQPMQSQQNPAQQLNHTQKVDFPGQVGVSSSTANVTQKAAVKMSPIHQLLFESKKTKTTVNIGLVADMPPVELMRVLADSYDDGEKQVLEYIATTLDVEDIKQQIAKQIWLSAFSNKPKRRNVKEE